jgi:hypothetical protein
MAPLFSVETALRVVPLLWILAGDIGFTALTVTSQWLTIWRSADRIILLRLPDIFLSFKVQATLEASGRL